jgi:hypothetical protein
MRTLPARNTLGVTQPGFDKCVVDKFELREALLRDLVVANWSWLVVANWSGMPRIARKRTLN